MMRVSFTLLFLASLAVAQETAKKPGLTDAEKKAVTALAVEYLDAKTPEDKLKISEKLAAYRPAKADLAALLAKIQLHFRKSGPFHDGKSTSKCGHPTYPGTYIIQLPGGAKKGEKVGLFISLHGGGEGVGEGSQIQSLFGVPGQGMINIYPTVCEKTGGAWNEPREEAYIFAIIDELKRTYNIDTNRIYLAGHSMGGFGTWSIGGLHADVFAAISPQAGGADMDMAYNLKNTPIWLYHSTDDPRVSSKPDERELAKLNELKTKYGPYDFVGKIYNDIGHGTPKEGLQPIWTWMCGKVRDPLPKQVIWSVGRATVEHFYWLKKKGGCWSLLDARRDKNKFTLTGNAHETTILLNEKMVDFTKPVVVEIEGKEVFNAIVPLSAAALVDTFDSRHDPEHAFSAWIYLP